MASTPRICARNWRCARGEIDLVAEKDGVLIFVEVRARRGDRLGTPEESITPAKRAKLIAAAQTYLDEHDWRHQVEVFRALYAGVSLIGAFYLPSILAAMNRDKSPEMARPAEK